MLATQIAFKKINSRNIFFMFQKLVFKVIIIAKSNKIILISNNLMRL